MPLFPWGLVRRLLSEGWLLVAVSEQSTPIAETRTSLAPKQLLPCLPHPPPTPTKMQVAGWREICVFLFVA